MTDKEEILVADGKNHRIQKFSTDCIFITAVGRKGKGPLQFDIPVGIAIHPYSKMIFIAESDNHCV